MTALYLVRHAHSDWTPDESRPLSPIGMKDAQSVARTLVKFPITQIVSSPYLRARQTIEPYAERAGLKILEDHRLRERHLGDIGHTSFKDAIKRTWLDPDFAYPEGESIHQAQSRALEALAEYVHTETTKHVVISTHGNLLTIILNHFDSRIGFHFWENLTLPDIYCVNTDSGEGPEVIRIWQPLSDRTDG
jgi:2,3-bisphosphoglycerate-dependent phosphoglycerate mutase